MEPNSRAYFGDKLRRTRADALKAEVITGMPYEKFADIQNIYNNFRQRTKLRSLEKKQGRWRLEGRTAETSSVNCITEANQAICSVQNTVHQPRGEIYNRTI